MYCDSTRGSHSGTDGHTKNRLHDRIHVAATAHNISNDIKGNAPEKVATWNAFCLADMGDTGAAFIAAPQIPPRNITWAKKGKWVHWSKVAFEKYFIFNMKRGSTDPLFQKLALKVMGLNRLKD